MQDLAQHSAFAQTRADTRRAMHRGWRRRCPYCGSGHLFKGYISVTPSCTVCRQPLKAFETARWVTYLTALALIGLHAALGYLLFRSFQPDPLILFTIFVVGGVSLTLYLLPKIKGVAIGYRWARQRTEPDG